MICLKPVENAPGTTPSGTGASQSRLAKAAQEFESLLLSSLLSGSHQGEIASSSDKQDPAGDTVQSLGNQAMAEALSARGGIGIAKMLLHQLQPPTVSGATNVPATGLEGPITTS
jgi:Rod binding domain-containing protein